MTMLESQHHLIFYPEDRTKLDECTRRRPATGEPCSLPTAIVVPHASYDMVCEALHRSFEHVAMQKPSKVVFLGPLHQEVLGEHEPAFLFTPQAEGIRVAENEHIFDTALATELCTQFKAHVMREDSYFIEEPALELTLPFIQSYFPGTVVLPLLCKSCDKSQLAIYTQVIKHITDIDDKVLFIISANANALLPAFEAAKHATAFADALSQGTCLSEGLRMHTISSCNTAALEAVGRQQWGAGRWNIVGIYLAGIQRQDIHAESDENEKRVWHISAVLGDAHANQ
ncbi:MAG TPA: AmmeMemoRadiSam system protein B [Sphaerochaeta sp.]|nr:AmmeMemoRadiSam system protein B [Sphaerochaeta sp.]